MLIVLALIVVILLLFLAFNSDNIKGAVGEARVNFKIDFLGPEYIALHDVTLRNANGSTSQIDHIVLSEYGIFVIETKNYTGWIFGNEKAENWTQIIFKNRYQFRNPVKQNMGHVYALKGSLSNYPNIHYFPIVVFAGNAKLKNIESSVPVIYDYYLKSTIEDLSTEKCLTIEQIGKIKDLLESVELKEKSAHKEHIKNIQQRVYEKRLKTANMICPQCNGELKLRNGRYGKFYGCSNYPQCRFTMPY
jgi:hypothetical protein